MTKAKTQIRSTSKSSDQTTTRKTASAARDIPEASALKSISDQRLLSRIRKLSDRERETVLSILVHLIEIDRRRLYLPLGFGSLYEFCVKHLGYCEATAARRVNVARCISQIPLACRALASGKVTLTNLALITKVITRENARELLSRIAGASKKEVELLVSSRNPRAAIKDSIRPVHVRTIIEVPVADAVTTEGGKRFTTTGDGKNLATSKAAIPEVACSKGSGTAAATESGRSPAVTEKRIVIEERLKFTFGADREFLAKLDQIRSLLSSKHHRKLECEELFSILMDEYIERHSPEGRISRKRKREERKAGPGKNRPGKNGTSRKTGAASANQKKTILQKNNGSSKEPERSRYIPLKVCDEVHARDNGRCTYVSPAGRRCGTTWDLQVDHIVPFARGGDNSPSNLRLLCARHNRLEAEKAYGTKHMEQYLKKNTGHDRKSKGRLLREHRASYSSSFNSLVCGCRADGNILSVPLTITSIRTSTRLLPAAKVTLRYRDRISVFVDLHPSRRVWLPPAA